MCALQVSRRNRISFSGSRKCVYRFYWPGGREATLFVNALINAPADGTAIKTSLPGAFVLTLNSASLNAVTLPGLYARRISPDETNILRYGEGTSGRRGGGGGGLAGEENLVAEIGADCNKLIAIITEG